MKQLHPSVAVLMTLVFVLACGDDVTDTPSNAELSLTVTTTGTLTDPDGYVVVVDDTLRNRVGRNSETLLTLRPGQHVIRLEDLSSDCTAPVTAWVRFVASGSQAKVSIEVFCLGNGSIFITTETQGSELDPDGYLVTFEGQIRGVGSQGELRIPDVRPGSYNVRLRGVAGNCIVDGGASRYVTVQEATDATVRFSLVCSPKRVHLPGDYVVVASRYSSDWDSDLYLLPIDGSFRERLTDDPGDDFAPTFSPNGDRIAYLRQAPGSFNPPTIVILDRNSRRETPLGLRSEFPVSWSPDGTQIVFNRNKSLAVADAVSGEFRLLGVNTSREAYWSPDGTRIAFTQGSKEKSQVNLINVDGTNFQQVGSAGWREAQPWSPDGSSLLFRISGPPSCNYYYYYYYGCTAVGLLVALDLASGQEQAIGISGVQASAWMPEGDRLLVLIGGSISTVRLDGTGLASLLASPTAVEYFAVGRVR